MEEYDIPDMAKIAAVLLEGVVPDEQMGPMKVDTFANYLGGLNGDCESGMVSLEDFDFVQFRQRGGYMTEDFSYLLGLEIDVWAKTRDRAMDLMNEIHPRILGSAMTSPLGFQIEDVETLNGPEEDFQVVTDERNVSNHFQFKVGVRWK